MWSFSPVKARNTASYSNICILSVCSSFENYPRKFDSSFTDATLGGFGSGCKFIYPLVAVEDHLPWTCAPHATPEASVESASYKTRTFSFGPHGRPRSVSGGFVQ